LPKCPGVEDVIQNGCDCTCPGGKWSVEDGWSSNGGLIIGNIRFWLTAVCENKPKLKVRLGGSFWGGGIVAGLAGRMGLGKLSSISGANSCDALTMPISARAYSVNGKIFGGTALFVGTVGKGRVYYELYGVGMQLKIKQLVKAPVGAVAAWGNVWIKRKICVNGQWVKF